MNQSIIGGEQTNSPKPVTSTVAGSKQLLDVAILDGSGNQITSFGGAVTPTVTTLVNTTNVASGTVYYPSATGQAMGNNKNLSLTGTLADADATSTITLEVTNGDTTTGTWVQAFGYEYLTGKPLNKIEAASATKTFAWDFENLNFKNYRVKLVTGDATNTVEIVSRLN